MVNKRTSVQVFGRENLGPQFELTAFDEVASLLLEHRVVVRDSDKLVIAEAFSIGDVRKVRIAGLAELSDDEGFVELRVA